MAILYDNSAAASYDGYLVSTKIVPYTTSGSNRALFFSITTDFSFGPYPAAAFSSITYNGVPLTKLHEFRLESSRSYSTWYLANPDEGTHDFAITATDNRLGYPRYSVVSYNGVSQSSLPEVTGPTISTYPSFATSLANTITTTSDNSLVICAVHSRGGISSSPNATIRGNNGRQAFLEAGPVSPAGARTTTFNSNNETLYSNIYAIAEAPLPPETLSTDFVEFTFESPSETKDETRGIVYKIKKSISVTRDSDYAVITDDSVQKPLAYEVVRSVTQGLSAVYSVKTPRSETKGLGYYVQKQDAKTRTSGYTLEVTKSATKTAQYEIKTSESATAPLAYAIRLGKVPTRTLRYNIQPSYSHGDESTLPAGVDNLENLYSLGEILDVATDNSTYVCSVGAGYVLHQFKASSANNTGSINMTWNGKTDRDTFDSTVFLQIYNHNTATWETLASENTVAAGFDFTLSGQIETNVGNYYSTENIVTARIYQQVI